MAISKRPFIYATFILSCAAIGLNVTSLATQAWVEAYMESYVAPKPTTRDHITYGLFSGTLIYHILEKPTASEVYITCMYSENVCAWSCTPDADARKAELQQLYEEGTAPERKCIESASKLLATARGNYTEGGVARKKDSKAMQREDKVADQQFINAALRVTTIVFLAIGLLFATVAGVLSVVNSAMNPTEPIFAIFGLYVWNGIAAFCDFMVLALWGAHFNLTLSKNVAYSEVITGEVISNGLAVLGYSYWLILGAMLMHATNLSILGVRKYLIDQDPPDKTVKVEENTDGVIFLY